MAGGVHIARPGLHTTVQDLGRWGFQSQGVSVAGPMDPFAHRLANALVGNARSAATLEVTLVGPELEFEDERVVAITGAEFIVTLDTGPAPHMQAFTVPARGRLRFGVRTRGARAYLAVSGGFDVPLILGSLATHVSSGMGGWLGRALAKGDRLPLGVPQPRARSHRSPPVVYRQIDPSDIVRILPGPDGERFAEDALDALQSAPYTVTADSDRMGFRLNGPAIRHSRGADIISGATPVGTLQVPGSGQPLLLMADRQTTGGYPRIATVISADIGLAGQAAPGDSLAFTTCTRADALAALIGRERPLLALETSI